MATSYNGWPATQTGDGIDRNFTAAGQKFPGGVRAGGVATIFRWLIERLNEVEPIVAGWNWGYEYRANVNNPSALSCHSSGTAIDYNAPNHPNGARGTWSTTEVTKIRWFLAQLDGVVRWGYDFTGTKDEMHFEIIGSQADVDRVAASLSSPGKPNPVEEDDMPYTEQQIKDLVYAGVQWWSEDKANTKLNPLVIKDAVQAQVGGPFAEIKAQIAALTSAVAAIAEKVGTPAPVTPQPATYTVAAGDTLGAIAKKFGVTVDQLVAWNGIADPNNISVGQVLKVSDPGKA